MSKNIIGVAIVDNAGCMDYKNRIPLKIPQYVEYIKRMMKGNPVITTRKAYPEIMKVFMPKDVIIVSESDEPAEDKRTVVKTIEEALELTEKMGSPKGDVIVMAGVTATMAWLNKGIYNEFMKVCIDVEWPKERSLDFDFSYYEQIKVTEEFYYSGYSFWYERYNMKKRLARSVKHEMHLTRLETLEVDEEESED